MNNKQDIINMSWGDVKNKFNLIISNNASNNKITYGKFRNRDKDSKDFINQLIQIFWYLDNSNKMWYYKSMVWYFKDINDIVSQSNKPVTEDNAVYIYNSAVRYYFVQNGDLLNKKDLNNILDRYKRYRGMAKLSKYRWDLENEDLIKRTIQYMQESDLKKYINNPDSEMDRKIAIERYRSNITDILL